MFFNRNILLSLTFGVSIASAQQQRPNIVLILADDLGFSDLGCYGGEIETPNLNKLADQGIRLTEMYNSARSCPSRACLLTGLYPHQVGLGHMEAGKSRQNWPQGYSGFRDNDNVTIAEVLQKEGYYTAMSGKWHLGLQKPTNRGFDDYYGLLGGFDSFWDSSKYVRLPQGAEPTLPVENNFYATHAITDYAIEFMEKGRELNKPVFLYLAYNAPHFPLHAPKEVIDKYMPYYLKGWDVIRDERFKRISQMHLLQGNPQMSPRGPVPASMFIDEPHEVPAWNSLTKEQQYDLARRMAIYAAMVDIMDQNIGRFIHAIKESRQLDNTLIFFLSDNGACAEWHEFGFDYKTGTQYVIHTGKELDEMGQPGTYHHYGTGWANVCNTPLKLYKHFATEGGISTPTIVWWGNHIKEKGAINHTPCHFTDIMSTCVDVAHAQYPSTYKGHAVQPMEGVSLVPLIEGNALKTRAIFAEHEGNRMVRLGDWKLVATHYTGQDWELYNIKEDRTEQNNLAPQYPEMVKELEAMYFQWAQRAHVEPFPQMWNKYNKKQFKIYKER